MKVLVKNLIINKAYYKEFDTTPYVGALLEDGIVVFSDLEEINTNGDIFSCWVVVIKKEDFLSRLLRRLGF